MFDRLKAFRALAEEIREKDRQAEKQADAAGARHTVRVSVQSGDDFLSPLSPDGAPVIS